MKGLQLLVAGAQGVAETFQSMYIHRFYGEFEFHSPRINLYSKIISFNKEATAKYRSTGGAARYTLAV